MRKIGLFLLVFSLAYGQAQEMSSEPRLTVSTLNAWGIPFFSKKLSERFFKIGKESVRSDVLGLQEVFHGSGQIVRALQAGQSFVYPPGSFPWLRSGLMFITKHKVTNKKHFPFPDCKGIQCVVDRGILYMQIQLPGGQLINLFNLHLQAYEEHRETRRMQLKKIEKVLKERSQDGLPIIVLGDFNVMDSGPELKIVKAAMRGFRDVWKEKGEGAGHTWDPEKNPWAEHEGESQMLQRLDYIFVKDGVERAWEVEAVHVDFNKEGMFLSDHFGVRAKLRLRPAAAAQIKLSLATGTDNQ